MKRHGIALAFLLCGVLAASCQEKQSPVLAWAGLDFGTDIMSTAIGVNAELGGLVYRNWYLDLAGEVLGASSSYALLAAGFRYYPYGNGLVAGIDLGACKVMLTPAGVWCFAASGLVAYDFGCVVLGAKANLYALAAPRASFALFADFAGPVGEAIVGGLILGRIRSPAPQ